jgi:putative Ca2+/H+ antiporter (TMEM165/GDT1 family)
VDLGIAATVFGLIFVAELPDKTALASLALAAKYPPLWVFTGVAAAFAMHVGIAIAAGSALRALPHRVVEGVVSALFLLGAVLLWRHGEEEEEEAEEVAEQGYRTFRTVAGASFAVIAVAELGDLTQILTANLAARYHDTVAVAVGATLGLWAVGGLAVTSGRSLLRFVPMRLIIRTASVIMVVLAVLSGVDAIRG